MSKMIYDPNFEDKLIPLGLTDFEEVQIETLGHQDIGSRVLGILSGNIDFKAKDDLEYDQDEGSWEDSDPIFDPTNQPLDKVDALEISAAINEKVEAVKSEMVKTEVTPLVDDVKTVKTETVNPSITSGDNA